MHIRSKLTTAAALLTIGLGTSACDLWSTDAKTEPPDIPFAELKDPSISDNASSNSPSFQ